MQEFYKGQKLYYRSGSNIKECEIIGWSKDKIYVKLSDGRKYSGPKWRVSYSMFYGAQDLVEAERKRQGRPKTLFEPEKIYSRYSRVQHGSYGLTGYNNNKEKYKDEKASGANGYTETNIFDGTGNYSREHKQSGSKKRDKTTRLQQFNNENF